jgi:hypothetical protein
MIAAVAALALAAAACSPKSPTPDQAAATPALTASATSAGAPSSPSSLAAQSAATTLPASCQTLLASMQSCSDNLTRKGSPLGNQIRLSMTDMRNGIAGAPAAQAASFCDAEATAFNQRAQAAHC